jgi:hypothetical protein
VFCESYIAPLLDELKYNINLRMHYIGEKQVWLPHTGITRLAASKGNQSPSAWRKRFSNH